MAEQGSGRDCLAASGNSNRWPWPRGICSSSPFMFTWWEWRGWTHRCEGCRLARLFSEALSFVNMWGSLCLHKSSKGKVWYLDIKTFWSDLEEAGKRKSLPFSLFKICLRHRVSFFNYEVPELFWTSKSRHTSFWSCQRTETKFLHASCDQALHSSN